MIDRLVDRVPVLPGRLDFALLPSTDPPIDATPLLNVSSSQYGADGDRLVVVDDAALAYTRFFADFGPLDLAQTIRVCCALDAALRVPGHVVVCCQPHPHARANTVALLVIYLVLARAHSPEQAIAPFKGLGPPAGFRDAARGICSFLLSTVDCARAVHRAVTADIFKFERFDVAEFDRLKRDSMTWLIPNKLLAFRGPCDDGSSGLSARVAADRLRVLGVTCVVRLNEPAAYDRKAFVAVGIRHVELFFPDGSVPSDDIVSAFLRVVEREQGSVAVHCHAGLGRTGTLAAVWLIKHLGFSAREAIAWCRICRPGSIVGAQQHFLVVKERELRTGKAVKKVEQTQQRQPSRSGSGLPPLQWNQTPTPLRG